MFRSMGWPGCRYKRVGRWPGGSLRDSLATMFSSRHLGLGHCLCRLSMLALWTLLVIFILYRSMPSSHMDPDEESGAIPHHQSLTRTTTGYLSEPLETTTLDLVAPTLASRPFSQRAQHYSSQAPANSVTSVSSGKLPILSTTRKSPVSEYARQSAVFILIIQDEGEAKHSTSETFKRNRSKQPQPGLNLYPANNARHIPRSSEATAAASRVAGDDDDGHHLVIPAHIQQLTEILESSRIGFTIGSTRHGMPSQLLDSSAGPRRFSVMVIDDFIRYTRLNRWLRDQLDRHCRTRQIGVITYLSDNHSLHQQRPLDNSAAGTTRSPSGGTHREGDQRGAVFRLFATDQFPLAFEPMGQLDCRSNASATSRCLVNYQLNDKASILRTLRARPDFVIGGPLAAVGPSSAVALSSNHVTYEPLTWAQLAPPSRVARRAARSAVQTGNKLTASRGSAPPTSTRRADRTGRALLKRAILPPTANSERAAAVDDKGAAAVAAAAADSNQADLLGGAAAENNEDDPGGAGSDPAPSAYDDDDQSSPSDTPASNGPPDGERKILSMLDQGLYDDIRRVIFGLTSSTGGSWLDRLLVLDAIEHLSSGEIMTPLERYIQIDIDDIFVGATGTRLQREDVDALLRAQEEFGQLYFQGTGFQFQLGFSGKHFKRGNAAERAGDEHLMRNADKFAWFCHFWSHSKAHLYNDTQTLKVELQRNLDFARSHKLTLVGHSEPLSSDQRALGRQEMPPTYAVAPHHSGVYPVHEQLYEAWREVLNVQVTSTEEYPHLRPARSRRGFVHKAIKVLPRQTCGLYTHTIFRNRYPGGWARMLASIRGGELFETVLHNPANIYMTHMSNYANDRLALVTFRELFKFVRENTNLRLQFAAPARHTTATTSGGGGASDDNTPKAGPLFLADYYFALHPEEREPLWTNPCDDKRHLAIWAPEKLELCPRAPQVLIVGPQKTGTTALQSFLELNPSIRSSAPSPRDFEEVQFFNEKHYDKGPHWYFERFKLSTSETSSASSEGMSVNDAQSLIHLDKSATYFDEPKAPARASALLPQAHIIISLIDPGDRAHSWYQHIRAHGDNEPARRMTFDEVLMFDEEGGGAGQAANSSTTASSTMSSRQLVELRALRARCLTPGYYANHLLRWLAHYPARQIVIVDGAWFKYNPAAVLNRLQLLLRLPRQVDYNHLLVYSPSKGFYCERRRNATGAANHGHQAPATTPRCLGPGKGRKYAPMSEEARAFLGRHYAAHNRQLARLLYEIGQPLPTWLDESVNSLPVSQLATTATHNSYYNQ